MESNILAYSIVSYRIVSYRIYKYCNNLNKTFFLFFCVYIREAKVDVAFKKGAWIKGAWIKDYG